MPVTLILKVTLGNIILSHQNETSLLIFGHGDNSEFSEFFGRTIPNAILPFSCSSHHDSLTALRSSQTFGSLSIIKDFRVTVFCTIRKNETRNFSDNQSLNYRCSTNYERFIRKHILNSKKNILKEILSYHFLTSVPKNDNSKFF